MVIRSNVKKKILILLLGGVALGLATSPKAQKRIFRALAWEWRKANKNKLRRNISELENHKFIRYRKKGEWWNIELTKKGKTAARKLGLDNLKIKKPGKWDQKWRVVLFDIPEKKRIGRDALRRKIKELGFVELQKSVFVYPYPCRKEIEIVLKFFKIKKFVQQCAIVDLDKSSDKKLRKKFGL